MTSRSRRRRDCSDNGCGMARANLRFVYEPGKRLPYCGKWSARSVSIEIRRPALARTAAIAPQPGRLEQERKRTKAIAAPAVSGLGTGWKNLAPVPKPSAMRARRFGLLNCVCRKSELRARRNTAPERLSHVRSDKNVNTAIWRRSCGKRSLTNRSRLSDNPARLALTDDDREDVI